MAHDHTAELILRNDPVDHETESHEDPWEVWRREDQQTQKAESGVGIATSPDIHETRRQRGTKEWKREEWRQYEQGGHGVDQQPREVGRRTTGGLLEESRVPLKEEDME